MDKDFDLYLGGDSFGGSPEGAGMDTNLGGEDAMAPDMTPVEGGEMMGAEGADVQAADQAIDEMAAEAGDIPAGDLPTDGGEADDMSGGEATDDALQKMLDSLNITSDEAVSSSEDIKQAAEDVKAAVPEANTELQVKIDSLLEKLAEKEANEIKMQKTIDILKGEYEKTLNDKISLEYGTASDSKIVQLINDDPDLKSLLAAKMYEGENSQEKLSDARKMGWEAVSGTRVDDLIGQRKNAEIEAMGGGEDVGVDLGGEEEGMYI